MNFYGMVTLYALALSPIFFVGFVYKMKQAHYKIRVRDLWSAALVSCIPIFREIVFYCMFFIKE